MATPRIEIKHLKLIQTIAETENLTRAAQRLLISQPALSRQLLDAESRLGTNLFFRSKKRMMLTPEGARMLASANTILKELERAELDISKIVHGETGTLRIGVACLFCFQWLPAVIVDFQKSYLKVDLAISTSYNFPGDLKTEAFDMVVTAAPFSKEELSCVHLFKDEMVAIMATDHPLSAKRFLMPNDLAGNKLIVSINLPLNHFSHLLWPGETTAPEAVMRIDQPHAIIELVRAGLGVSIAPRWAVRSYLASGQLAAVPISARGIHPVWKVVYLKRDALPAFQQKFIDLMIQHNLP